MSSAAAWSVDPGWNITGGLTAHTPGTAGAVGQNFSAAAGKWYRLAFTVSGRTAGTITPGFTGGSVRHGATLSANGYHLDRIQALTGNNRIEFVASADFNGSINLSGFPRVNTGLPGGVGPYRMPGPTTPMRPDTAETR